MRLFPRSENPYQGLGSVCVLKGDYRQAAEAYRNLLAVAPTNVTAIEMLGLLENESHDATDGSR